MKIKVIVIIVFILFMAMLSPLVARVGKWRVVHVWESPKGTFGIDRHLRLSVEEFYSIVDPFELYPEHRILVSDGGYAYICYIEFDSHDNISTFKVDWQKDDVSISGQSWIKVTIPKDRIMDQIGR
jgi:hypothetical protein